LDEETMGLREIVRSEGYVGKTAGEILDAMNAAVNGGESLAMQIDDFHRPLELHDVVWAMENHE
jgi:hypothetical protein